MERNFVSHTVLLVDDEPKVLAGLQRALYREPYEVLCACSAPVVSASEPSDVITLAPPADRQPDSALARRQAGRPGQFGPNSQGLSARSGFLRQPRPSRVSGHWQHGQPSVA